MVVVVSRLADEEAEVKGEKQSIQDRPAGQAGDRLPAPQYSTSVEFVMATLSFMQI